MDDEIIIDDPDIVSMAEDLARQQNCTPEQAVLFALREYAAGHGL